jgi:hypothetical protein
LALVLVVAVLTHVHASVLPKAIGPLPATGVSRLRWPAIGFLVVAAGLGISLLRARSGRRP